MLTFEKLAEGFRELGVKDGDTLPVHSSYKSLGEVDGGPQTVNRALEGVRGTDKDGTLIRTYNDNIFWHTTSVFYIGPLTG